MADTYTSSTTMPSWVQPFAAGFLDRAQQVANMPYQAYGGQTVANFNPFQTSAFQGIADRAGAGNPAMNAANQQLTSTIQGNNLQGNPYLNQQIDAVQGDMARNWNNVAKPSWATANAQSGSFGNAGLALAENDAFANTQRNAMNTASNMRYQNYSDERGRQMQAMGMAPSFAAADYNDMNQLLNAGNQVQQQDQKAMTDSYQRFLESRGYPQQQLDVMKGALGGVNFGSNTTQTAPGTSTGASVVGGLLTGTQIWDWLFGGP